MAIEKFQDWYEHRHQYQKDWKKRTGGKMGDEREFDESAVENRIGIFLESLGLKRPE